MNLHSRWLDKISARLARSEPRERRNFIMRLVIHNFHGNVILKRSRDRVFNTRKFILYLFLLILESQQWGKLGESKSREIVSEDNQTFNRNAIRLYLVPARQPKRLFSTSPLALEASRLTLFLFYSCNFS